MQQWPSTLPAPLVAGSSIQDKPNQVRTAMESGPDRVDRIAADYASELKVKWLLTESQARTLRLFHGGAINDGTDWFDMSVNSGGGFARHRVRILGGKLSWSRQGSLHQVSATLEITQRIINWS